MEQWNEISFNQILDALQPQADDNAIRLYYLRIPNDAPIVQTNREDYKEINDSLQVIMSALDENKNNINEGDYLTISNQLRSIFTKINNENQPEQADEPPTEQESQVAPQNQFDARAISFIIGYSTCQFIRRNTPQNIKLWINIFLTYVGVTCAQLATVVPRPLYPILCLAFLLMITMSSIAVALFVLACTYLIFELHNIVAVLKYISIWSILLFLEFIKTSFAPDQSGHDSFMVMVSWATRFLEAYH
jgi:hypothetical protein